MRTKAIVIRKTPAGEHDQMVTLYSEDFGTMRAMARGSLRPSSLQSMHLETLNVIDFEVIQGRAWPIISSAMLIDPHRGVKDSLPKLAAVQFFTEVLDKIAFENEKDSQLWEFLTAMLSDFEGADAEDVLSLFRTQQAKFLKVLGYAPQIERCVVCSTNPFAGSEKMIALSTELGGVMCSDCFLAGGRGILLEKADLGSLVGDMGAPAGKHSALDTFFEHTVGRKLSSLSFLYGVLK